MRHGARAGRRDPDRLRRGRGRSARRPGGDAAVFGHSSGAVLALLAASVGVAVSRLHLSEPPLRFDDPDHAPDLPERLQAAVDAGRPDAAVTLFQREPVGLPEAVVEQIRASPMFASLVPLAQSVVHDALLAREVSRPTEAMSGVGVPVTVLRGEPTFPFLGRAPSGSPPPCQAPSSSSCRSRTTTASTRRERPGRSAPARRPRPEGLRSSRPPRAARVSPRRCPGRRRASTRSAASRS